MSAVNLTVYPYDDTAPMGPDPKIVHLDCGRDRAMAYRRNQLDGRATWTCECGLTIEYSRFGPANDTIGRAAINGQPTELPAKSFWSNLATVVYLHSP